MDPLLRNREQGSGLTAPAAVLETRLNDARMRLADKDEAVRVKAILALGRIKHEGALDTAIHVFQACATGRENLAAQQSIVTLCGGFPERSAETAVRLTTLISARVQNLSLTLNSPEFARSCDTIEAVLDGIALNGEPQSRLDSVIGNWYERIKEDFRAAPTDITLPNPRAVAAFKHNKMPEQDRIYMSAVQSMAMLVELMEGIHTPKSTEIKKELLSQIKPDGFGDYVLKPLSSYHDPELYEALQQVLERWGRSPITPTNRFFMACTALTELFRCHSDR